MEKELGSEDDSDFDDDNDDSNDDDQGNDISLDNGAGENDNADSPIIIESDDDFINDHSDIYEDQVDGHESDSEVSSSHLIQGQRLCLGL